ncbi:MAG TPA: response regulator [Pyrinomonadaceae bacterium]|nr:response regulator [Pyrinomonadaceae bacterium]
MIPRSRVIFYAENNERLLEIVRDVLEFAGWYVKACTDPVYILPTMQITKQHFDLLLIDNELRNFTGLELVRDIRRIPHRKEMPIILISIDDLTEEAREAGADAFLRKPNNLIELVDTIRRLLGEERDGENAKNEAAR